MEEKFTMFRNRLEKVNRHVSRMAKRQGVECYRIYDRDLPEFPYCIERYGPFVHVAEYKTRHSLSETEYELWLERSFDILTEVLGVSAGEVFVKYRQRKPGRGGQYVRQHQTGEVHQVSEGGLKFLVNLTDYLDTGLFLDHRITRSMVREQSRAKRVLNLFCYTGSFSVYAADGGAESVDSVDLSNTYLGWAEQNMALNGYRNPLRYRFLRQDVLQWLPGITPESYDLMVLDPPTFSNSKMMKAILDVQQDHGLLIRHCLRGLRKGGTLYFSTNYRRFQLQESEFLASDVKDITARTTAFDFSRLLERKCFLITK